MTPPIRAVTAGIAERHPLDFASVERAAAVVRDAADAFRADGYEVQTVRLSTRPAFIDLADWPASELLTYASALQHVLDGAAPDVILSAGPAPAHRPGFDLDRLAVIADLLIANPSLWATVQLATVADGVRSEAALPAVRIVQRLARETDEGFGAFRFAVLAGVEPGAPFFPAGYHDGPASLSIGWQGASLVAEGIEAGRSEGELEPAAITEAVRRSVVAAARPIVELASRLAVERGLAFGGIDVSPAPAGGDSIGAAIESALGAPLGSPGPLSVVGAITEALRDTGLPTCGYSGLMLPVLEDEVLAERWSDRRLALDQLLAYSAICGTGLDAVPLPDDMGEAELAGVYRDVATLAVRLRKPLSARLMPVPGKGRGEMSAFTSPHIVNARI